MQILYFAWLRERLNRGSDEISPPPHVVTLSDLVDYLCAQDETLALAMENRKLFKLSIDARIVPPDTPLGDAKIVAILPPMTGG